MGHPADLAEVENSLLFAHRPALELRIDLARAIQSLPDHYREIVILRDIQERSIGEISQALGRSREAVKANLHRARVLLREYLTR
jgi:RNA polymerase sigma-70 factor (ECF subfamily)